MEDWGFWAVAAVLALAVALPLLTTLWRDRDLVPPAAKDMQVYKDQLSEIDRDVTRGTLAADEAQRLRAEIARRLLDADRLLDAGRLLTVAAPTRAAHSSPAPALLITALIAASGAAYWTLGAPGYPDLPLKDRLAQSDALMAARPSQATAVGGTPAPQPPTDIAPDFLDLMGKLRLAVADRPDDLRGLELLSRNEAALGNFTAAEAAQRQLIAVKGDAATGADHASLAEVLIAAAGGYVSPEAEAELITALQLDPANPLARYFSGLMFSQSGRFDRTFALWRPLLDEGPADAPWVVAIRARMEDVAYRAGIKYTLPPQTGPGAADIAAAADMAPEDRQAMIEGMVAQLSDRLATDGGTVEDWDRLIRSLVVLKRADEAQTIYDEAKTRFAGRDPELSFLRLAAVETGLVP